MYGDAFGVTLIGPIGSSPFKDGRAEEEAVEAARVEFAVISVDRRLG